MAKGGSEPVDAGQERQEVAGEHRRAVHMGTADPDHADTRTGGSWRAGCVETRTPGSEGGLRKRTGRKTDTAPQPDPYVWRAQAEHAAESLTKGARVLVCGRLRQRSWETEDGERRQLIEIEADELGASLKFHTATLTKASRARSHAGSDTEPAEASP